MSACKCLFSSISDQCNHRCVGPFLLLTIDGFHARDL